MDKIFVEVAVPATGKNYEFLLPSVMKVGVAAELIAQAVLEMEGLRASKENVMLCSYDDEKVLPNNSTIEKAGVIDGGKLLLI